MDIKGGAGRPLPLYEDMKKLFAVFRVLGVLGIGVFRVVGGEKFGLWEFKLFKSECILGDIAFGSMV